MRYGFKELWWNFRIKQHSGIDLSYCFEQEYNKLTLDDENKGNIYIEGYTSCNITVVHIHNLYRCSGKTTSFIKCCNDFQYTHRQNRRLYIGANHSIAEHVKRKLTSGSEADAYPYYYLNDDNIFKCNYTLVFVDDFDLIKNSKPHLIYDEQFVLQKLHQVCSYTQKCLALIIH